MPPFASLLHRYYLIFAVDSIPAICAITGDSFLIFTSNLFAILGLRSHYFALAGMVKQCRYLKAALTIVLLVLGVRLLLAESLKLILEQIEPIPQLARSARSVLELHAFRPPAEVS